MTPSWIRLLWVNLCLIGYRILYVLKWGVFSLQSAAVTTRQHTPPHRILILRYDRLGDLICTSPLIDVLHSYYPDALIDILGSSRNAFLCDEDPRVHRVIALNGSRQDWAHLAMLRRTRYDFIFSLIAHHPAWDAFLSVSLSHPETVRASMQGKAKYSWLFHITPFQHTLPKTHIATHWVNLAAYAFGHKSVTDAEIASFYPPRILFQQTAESSTFINENGIDAQRCIGLNLSAGSPSRQWPRERVEPFLTEFFLHYPTWKCVLFFTEEDEAFALALHQRFSSAIPIPKSFHFLRVCEILSEVALLITPDTGLMHAAVALKRPVVALFGSGNDEHHRWLWRPIGVEHRLLFSDVPKGVADISSREVLGAVSSLLETSTKRGVE